MNTTNESRKDPLAFNLYRLVPGNSIYEPILMGPAGQNAVISRGGGIEFGDHKIVIPLLKNYQHYPIEMSYRPPKADGC